MTKRTVLFCALFALLCARPLPAQEAKSSEPRHITLDEAVQLALKHNHVVRIAVYGVQEKEHTKDIARSAYFPLLRNDSNIAHLTDTQFIGIPAGGLGTVGGTPIPAQSTILNQGDLTMVTSGTQLTQPLSELWRVKSANDVARAELNETRSKERQTENEVAQGNRPPRHQGRQHVCHRARTRQDSRFWPGKASTRGRGREPFGDAHRQ